MGCDTHEWSEDSKEYFANRPLSMSVADRAANEARLAELEQQLKALQKEESVPLIDNRIGPNFGKEKFKPQPLRTELIWVGVDLDGTLATPLWTPDNPTTDIGDPILKNIKKVHELVAAGYKVIVHTSRPWTDYQIIEQWLRHYNIPFKEIQCGKPLYAAYIDDRAIHAEEESWLP
jgi:hypothetical protein